MRPPEIGSDTAKSKLQAKPGQYIPVKRPYLRFKAPCYIQTINYSKMYSNGIQGILDGKNGMMANKLYIMPCGSLCDNAPESLQIEL